MIAFALVLCAAFALPASAQDRRGVALGQSLPSQCLQNEGFIIPSGGSKGLYNCGASNDWTLISDFAGGSESIPAGAILLIDSGSCPAGYAEVAGLNGRTILGTVAANGNAGGTGGSATITPQGTISAITQVITHTHTVSVTDPGHTHTLPVGATDDTSAPFDRADAGTNTSGANATTASGSNTTGISASTANPAGGVASITPTFTGTAFDPTPPFVRWIACKKT